MEDQLADQQIRQTANRLHSIAIHLLRGLQEADAESGLSRARLSALSVVVFAGPLRVSRLAELEGVKPPTMTLLVRGLEKEGFVRRYSDPTDARASLVSATDEGRQVLRETRTRRLTAVEEKLRELTRRERVVVEEAASILAVIYVPEGPPPLGDPAQPVVPDRSPGKSERVCQESQKRRTE